MECKICNYDVNKGQTISNMFFAKDHQYKQIFLCEDCYYNLGLIYVQDGFKIKEK